MMNFIKRAVTSVMRRPGKSIILLLLVFILGSVIGGAMSVEGAISNTNSNLRRNMRPLVSVAIDHNAWSQWVMEQNFDWINTFPPQQPRLTPSEVRALASLEYVADYDYIINYAMRSFNYSNPLSAADEWRDESTPVQFLLSGSSNTELLHVQQGIINIVSGREFLASEQNPGGERVAAIVSEEFARINNLSVNSIFTLQEWVRYPDEWGNVEPWGGDDFLDEYIFATIELEFEIVGIFDVEAVDEESEDAQQSIWERKRRLSTIYVPNWSLEQVAREVSDAIDEVFEVTGEEMSSWLAADRPKEGEELQMRIIPIFVLRDPDDLDRFKEAAQPLLSSEFFEFQDSQGDVTGIASSMNSLQTIANGVLYVALGATLLILSLLITLFLKDRRFEMGVYLALGEKKGRIITQILMEVLVTSVVAITFAVFAGNIMSDVVGRNMLMNELQNVPTNVDGPNFGMMPGSVFDEIGIPQTNLTVEEMIEQFDVSIDAQTVVLFYVIGLSTVIFSTLVPVIYVLRLNPKKVLM